MEFVVTMFVLVISVGCIYLIVRWFLSESFVPKGVVRFGILFVIAGLISGTILYLYSSFGIDTETFGKFGIIASTIYLFWLDRRKDKIYAKDTGKRQNETVSITLLISASSLVILPLILNFFF